MCCLKSMKPLCSFNQIRTCRYLININHTLLQTAKNVVLKGRAEFLTSVFFKSSTMLVEHSSAELGPVSSQEIWLTHQSRPLAANWLLTGSEKASYMVICRYMHVVQPYWGHASKP